LVSSTRWLFRLAPPCVCPMLKEIPSGFVSVGDKLSAETLHGALLFSVNVTESPMHLALANIRQPVVFRHINNAGDVISSSNEIVFDQFEPTQGHLALTSNDLEVTVTWVSNYTSDAAVRWGTSPIGFPHIIAAKNTTYTITDMCDAPANDPKNFIDPGIIFTATLSDLPPNQKIYYSFGSPSKGWSAVHYFHVLPPQTKSLSFIAFGDLGVTPDQQPAIISTQLMIDHLNTTDLVVHIGDISYARGHAYLWEQFFSEIQPVATRAPYMTSIGNHEYDFTGQPFHPSWSTYGTDSGGECGVPYIARLPMPYSDASSTFKNRTVYYSYNYGPVHFAMMDSESDFLPGSAQHDWLARDLASVDRNATPFVIVTNHRPMYDSSAGGFSPRSAKSATPSSRCWCSTLWMWCLWATCMCTSGPAGWWLASATSEGPCT